MTGVCNAGQSVARLLSLAILLLVFSSRRSAALTDVPKSYQLFMKFAK